MRVSPAALPPSFSTVSTISALLNLGRVLSLGSGWNSSPSNDVERKVELELERFSSTERTSTGMVLPHGRSVRLLTVCVLDVTSAIVNLCLKQRVMDRFYYFLQASMHLSRNATHRKKGSHKGEERCKKSHFYD